MRRGLSLIEVLIALVLLSVLAAPALVLLREHDTPLSADTVRARRFADRLLMEMEALEPEQLDAREKQWTADADGTPVRCSFRIQRHVNDRFGLDQLDVTVGYEDNGRPHGITRTVIRRNASQLAALARVRLHGDVEQLSDAELADGLAFAAYQDGVDDRAGFVEGSPYPARMYPPLVAEFEPTFDAAAEEELKKREDQLGDRFRNLEPGYGADGSVPRPHFAANVGVAH